MKNYLFWQVRLVYAELIQHHFPYSKAERGSSGHSLCVKANASFSRAGKAFELALSFHSLVSCSYEQPLHALPSSWLALEGRSIWSSINVSFKIMRAREEGRGVREFKAPNHYCLLFHQAFSLEQHPSLSPTLNFLSGQSCWLCEMFLPRVNLTVYREEFSPLSSLCFSFSILSLLLLPNPVNGI